MKTLGGKFMVKLAEQTAKAHSLATETSLETFEAADKFLKILRLTQAEWDAPVAILMDGKQVWPAAARQSTC